jgi:hypothetical protein
MTRETRTTRARRSGALVSAVLVAVLVQPLTAAPSYAGVNCELPPPLQVGDCTPPETEVTDGPEQETESRTAELTFTASEEGSTFECRLDSGDWVPDCGDPQSADGTTTGTTSYTDLSYGDHVFEVRATDSAEGSTNTDQTPATYTWTVVEPEGPPPPDEEAPQTVITNGADRWHLSPFLGITYRADEETSGFRCTVDGRTQRCGDGRVDLIGVRAGDHVFTVAARDTAGNLDPTPARERWTVPMNNTALTHSDEWEKLSGRGYFKDSYSITDDRGASIEQGKRGFRSLVLVATRCPECGVVAVYLGNELLDTVRLTSSSTEKRQIVPIDSWRRPQSGRVRLEVTTQGRDVIVEGLGFSARR